MAAWIVLSCLTVDHDVESIVLRHVRSVESIQSLRFRLKTNYVERGISEDITFVNVGPKSREIYVPNNGNALDRSQDGTKYRSRTYSASNRHGGNYAVGDQSEVGPRGYRFFSADRLLLQFTYPHQVQPLTLPELQAKSQKVAAVTNDENGDPVVRFVIPPHPDLPDGCECTLTFASKYGFLVSRKLVDCKRARVGRDFHWVTIDHRIEDFATLEDGAFFPTRARTVTKRATVGSNEAPFVENATFEVSELVVNQKLDERSLEVPIPQGTIVRGPSIGGNRHKAYVWGEDGPAKTLENPEEVAAYMQWRSQNSLPTRSSRGPWILGAGVLLATVGYVVYRRVSRR
jgi:hypothetical protein